MLDSVVVGFSSVAGGLRCAAAGREFADSLAVRYSKHGAVKNFIHGALSCKQCFMQSTNSDDESRYATND